MHVHQPAIDKIKASEITADVIAEALVSAASEAKRFNAAVSSMTLGYIDDDEEVTAEYVPEIVLRVKRPGSE